MFFENLKITFWESLKKHRLKKIILIARAETLFMLLFVKAPKKSILARLVVW